MGKKQKRKKGDARKIAQQKRAERGMKVDKITEKIKNIKFDVDNNLLKENQRAAKRFNRRWEV